MEQEKHTFEASKTGGTGRKQFKIPNQIDGSFHIWRFLTLREFLILVPFAVLGYFLYRYVFVSFSLNMRVFLSLLPLVLSASFLFIHPIKERKNVNLFQMLIWRVRYNQRQRRYYYRRKY